jgi:hypothetical protein
MISDHILTASVVQRFLSLNYLLEFIQENFFFLR